MAVWSVAEVPAGFVQIVRMPPLRTYAIVASLNNLGSGAILVALPLYWASAGLSAELIGVYAFAFAAAGLLGALVAAPVVARLRPFAALVAGLVICCGAAVVACLGAPHYLIVGAFCLASFVSPAMTTPITSWVARSVPDQVLGRTQSALWVCIRLLGALAPGAGGWLLARSHGGPAAFIPFAVVQSVGLVACVASRHLRSIPAPKEPPRDHDQGTKSP